MEKPVLIVEGAGKKYRIARGTSVKHLTLVDTFTDFWRGLFQQKMEKSGEADFWALQDVSFSIQPGERLGILGKNGSGKSTLLKLISKITAPSAGRAIVRGRVATLLEVGTGFHPELTGRENIFLCGAIMGMKRKEIVKHFDEIVAFSGIGKFLDTPVKRYSSGMYTRLGFSIGAHLNPDLLLLDEVLAVGDQDFQKKCLKKLKSLSENGTAVIFVSHDLGAISNFCTKGLLLENGRVKSFGNIEDVVNCYVQDVNDHAFSWTGEIGDDYVRFTEFSIVPPPGGRQHFNAGENIEVKISYEVLKESSNFIVGVKLRDTCNRLLAKSYACDAGERYQEFNTKGKHNLVFSFDSSILYENEYFLNLESVIHNVQPVVNGEIVLKFWVSHPNKIEHFSQVIHKPEVCLGYNWVKK